MDGLLIRLANMPDEFPEIQAIRHAVFQLEQSVPAELEFDGEDERSQHFIAFLKDKPVGTARIRAIGQGVVKIERLAVLAEARGLGIGRKIMEAVLEFLIDTNLSEVKIHAQSYVKAFYESLGFLPEGEIFEEAGIPHVKMRKSLTSA